MELEWRASESARSGWCNGFHVAQVLRSARGWSAYIAHTPVDGPRYYGTPEEAVAAAEAAVADEPPPQSTPSPAERRRFVRNRPQWVPPHPGTVPARRKR